jgi:hypothetical protein
MAKFSGIGPSKSDLKSVYTSQLFDRFSLLLRATAMTGSQQCTSGSERSRRSPIAPSTDGYASLDWTAQMRKGPPGQRSLGMMTTKNYLAYCMPNAAPLANGPLAVAPPKSAVP